MEEKHLYNRLLEKYRANQLTEEEYWEFVELSSRVELEKDKDLDVLARKDWNPSVNLLEQIRKEEYRINRTLLLRRWAWSSAAAIALLCMAWFLWPQKASENRIYQTGYNETLNIELPDGSKVLLNANSQLTWQGDWEQTNERQVTLKGEAYFDVTKVKDVSFEVVASDIRVNVLGTEFNVRNRKSESEVFLHEGKVDLQINSKIPTKVTMKPGDFVRYDKLDKKVSVTEHEQMNKKAGWVDGMLEFENKKISLILNEFEELYGKKFNIENPVLANKRMDFSLPYADWELVRKALEIAIGAEFVEVRDTIFVK